LDNYIEEVSGTTNFCHRAKEDVPEEERGDVQQRNRSPARLKEVEDLKMKSVYVGERY